MERKVSAVQVGGSLGRSHYVNGKFIASNLGIILTPTNNPEYPINVRFYSMYSNAIRKHIVNELANGTSKLTIPVNDLMNYYVEYFHISKQNGLVEYCNKAIVTLQQKLDKEKDNFNKRINSLL